MSTICEEPYCEKPLGHDGACGRADAPDRTARLVAALRGLVSAVSAQLTRGEDTTPGDFDRAWREACETLKEFESKERRRNDQRF